jgi:thiamine-phosphate pyrophosphorylase
LKLYALIDKATLKKSDKSLEWIVERVKKFDACLLQYRNKTGSFDEKKEDLLSIKSLCSDTPLIINDDITLIDFCDGIHLGQDDILNFADNITDAANFVRHTIGDKKLFGLSTRNAGEIEMANVLPVDYIGLGAYRKTNTKDTDNILGDALDFLAKSSKKPVAAIGGVKLHDKFKYVTYIVIGSGLYEDYSVFH